MAKHENKYFLFPPIHTHDTLQMLVLESTYPSTTTKNNGGEITYDKLFSRHYPQEGPRSQDSVPPDKQGHHPVVRHP